jgi:hypothetical protein
MASFLQILAQSLFYRWTKHGFALKECVLRVRIFSPAEGMRRCMRRLISPSVAKVREDLFGTEF